MELPIYNCQYYKLLPTLSQVDDAFWQEAVELCLAVDGERPYHPTKMRCLWNEDYLGIYFYSVDPDIWGTYENVNDPIYKEEVVEAFLAPDPDDLTHYFELELSPRNVPFATRIKNDGKVNLGFTWEPQWRTEVFVKGTLDNREDKDEFWSAKMLIPVTDLCQGIKPGDMWRANFYRIDRTPKSEYSAWSPIYKDPVDFHTPQRFGYLSFLR